MGKDVELITWDIEDTLMKKEDLYSPKGIAIVKSNCLQLLKEQPKIPLIPGIEKAMKTAQTRGAYQGIASSFAYQYANNYLTASNARNYIDPRLIVLAHQFAWEGEILNGKSYDEVLQSHLKPATKMLDITKGRLEKILGKEIDPSNCIHVGDMDHDLEVASRAGWKGYHIKEINELQRYLEK